MHSCKTEENVSGLKTLFRVSRNADSGKRRKLRKKKKTKRKRKINKKKVKTKKPKKSKKCNKDRKGKCMKKKRKGRKPRKRCRGSKCKRKMSKQDRNLESCFSKLYKYAAKLKKSRNIQNQVARIVANKKQISKKKDKVYVRLYSGISYFHFIFKE